MIRRINRGPDGKFVARTKTEYMAPCFICSNMTLFPIWAKCTANQNPPWDKRQPWCMECIEEHRFDFDRLWEKALK